MASILVVASVAAAVAMTVVLVVRLTPAPSVAVVEPAGTTQLTPAAQQQRNSDGTGLDDRAQTIATGDLARRVKMEQIKSMRWWTSMPLLPARMA